MGNLGDYNNSTEFSKREHVHTQQYIYRFQSVVWAPEPKAKGGSGKPRFGVEAQIYVPGMGWDTVNPHVQKNEFIIAFYYYVLGKELLGYEHVGLKADEIKTRFENLWGTKIE